ncbi:MAG: C_GCAxxG_C_C family protein [Ruminococcaceae bacterium]|nr:C_GCAxxG_C_C family protein [Oscillospiraceae bacterium]
MTHREKAIENFYKGYNCAQSVFLAFCDVTGFDEETALRISSSFGGGMGRLREVCGACSAMFMVAGLVCGYTDISTDEPKKEHYARIQALAAKFKEKHSTIICRELLSSLAPDTDPTPSARTEQYYKTRPCAKFIGDAADIIDGMLAENGVTFK